MASRYDDELWELVPADPGPPPAHLAEFVRALGPVERGARPRLRRRAPDAPSSTRAS